MGYYLGTITSEGNNIGLIKMVFRSLDAKEYVIGREHGKNAYEHYQYFVQCSGDLQEYIRKNQLGWHVEECRDPNASRDYCLKEGDCVIYPYTCVDADRRKRRSYTRNKYQSDLLQSVENQTDRNITVWIDRKGNHGKTIGWLDGIERRKVLPVPRAKLKQGRLSQWVCDAWNGEEIVWVDLPRYRSMDSDLCGDLEELKDGVCFDDRNHARYKVVRGIKILVTTNNWIDNKTYKALSEDRWDIHVIKDEEEKTEEDGTTL